MTIWLGIYICSFALEPPGMWALRVDERPHRDGEVDRAVDVGMVVGEALDLDVAQHALARPDEAALVHENGGAEVFAESVHLAAGRQRDEAQARVVVERVAEEHAVGDVDPPEEAAVGDDAVRAPGLVVGGGGELLDGPLAGSGGVAEEGVVALHGGGLVGGVELRDHVVAGAARVSDEAHGAAGGERDGEVGGHGGEAGRGAVAGVVEEVVDGVGDARALGGHLADREEEAVGGGGDDAGRVVGLARSRVGGEALGQEAQDQVGGARRVVEVEQEVGGAGGARLGPRVVGAGVDDDGDGHESHPRGLRLARHLPGGLPLRRFVAVVRRLRHLGHHGWLGQSFKSPDIASAIVCYSYLCIVPLFKLMYNLAVIVSFSPLLAVFRMQPLNPLAHYLEPWWGVEQARWLGWFELQFESWCGCKGKGEKERG
ncbi:hypothetical protein PVAP13_6KG249906 [Panicum virgatum]|uniref:Uncharacterized protein n=1 Tax=Panicum virgatum TaxID=38727 RepID=A0A8T0RFM9_PANVG|nr:hypothetical protein PVAP13_6KG249906 [Panicum virgatum]